MKLFFSSILLAWFAVASCAQQPQVLAPVPAPSAPASAGDTTPPTWKDRGHVFVAKLLGPQAILETVPGAAFDFARGFPRQWGRTPLGAAKRFGSQYGQFLVGETIELGVSALHQEDPRYFPMPGERFGKRLKHALVSTVIVRGAHGGNTLGVARLANVYGGWAVATLWNPPDQRNVLGILGYGSLGMSIKAGSNVFREFWPDVKKRLKH